MKNSGDIIEKVSDKYGISAASARIIIESAFYYVPIAARESDRDAGIFSQARVPFWGSFIVTKKERIRRAVENVIWQKTKKPPARVGMKIEVFAVVINPEGIDYLYKGIGTVLAVGEIRLRGKVIVEKGVKVVRIDSSGETFTGKYIDWYLVKKDEKLDNDGFIDTEITQGDTIALFDAD